MLGRKFIELKIDIEIYDGIYVIVVGKLSEFSINKKM
jgi:hypothetical protein